MARTYKPLYVLV